MSVNCSLCGHSFDPEEASSACEGCGLAKTCDLVACPNCGFEMPPEDKEPGELQVFEQLKNIFKVWSDES